MNLRDLIIEAIQNGTNERGLLEVELQLDSITVANALRSLTRHKRITHIISNRRDKNSNPIRVYFINPEGPMFDPRDKDAPAFGVPRVVRLTDTRHNAKGWCESHNHGSMQSGMNLF